MSYDKVLNHIGYLGLYHKVTFALILFLNIYMGFPTLIAVFNFVDIPFRCAVPELENDTFHIQSDAHQRLVNATVPYDVSTGLYSQCLIYSRQSIGDDNSTVPCERWVYNPVYASSSVISDLNLVCGRQLFKAHFVLMSTLGFVIGAIISGPTSDTFGRKTPMFTFLCTQIAALVIYASITSIPAMMFLVWVITVSSFAAFLISYTLVIELAGPGQRALAGCGPMVGWSLGMVLVDLYYSFMNDWRTANYIVAGFGFLMVLFWFVIPESPRWLLGRNRLEDVQKVFRKMAKVNKVNLPEDIELMSVVDSKEGKKPTKFPLKELGSLITTRVLCLRASIIAFSWFSLNLVYSGTIFFTGDLIEGNFYVNFAIQAIFESIGYALALVLKKYFGRIPLLCVFMLSSGACYLLNALVALLELGAGWFAIFTYATGKLANAGSFSIIYILVNELMPTTIRNSSVGMCTFVGQFGGIVAPYVAFLATLIPTAFGKSLPFFAFSTLSITCGLLILLLPETRNQKLPETIEDAKNMKRKGNQIPSDDIFKVG